jgi:hypothetical protein
LPFSLGALRFLFCSPGSLFPLTGSDQDRRTSVPSAFIASENAKEAEKRGHTFGLLFRSLLLRRRRPSLDLSPLSKKKKEKKG